MNTPLLWINLVLAVTLALVYTQRDLFTFGDRPVDFVLIASTPPESDSYKDILAGVQAFERDFGRNVTILVGDDDSDTSLARSLRQAIAMDPSGISMPGHQNSRLLLPFVTEALRQGSPVTFYSTPLANATELFGDRGTGFIGGEGQLNGEYATRSSLKSLPYEAGMSVLVMGEPDAPAKGTLLYGCLKQLEAVSAGAEYIQVRPALTDQEATAGDPRILERLEQSPKPDLIYWQAGDISQLTAALDAQGFDAQDLSVISFVPVPLLPKTEQVFVKSRFYERKLISCYVSLAQLHLTTQHGVAGLNVPINANL